MNDAMAPLPYEDADEVEHTLLADLIRRILDELDAWVASERAGMALADTAESVAGTLAIDAAGDAAGDVDRATVAPGDPSGLAAIGFGPSMRLRLDHAGVPSRAALASADAASLARALGDAIPLDTIELWISLARSA